MTVTLGCFSAVRVTSIPAATLLHGHSERGHYADRHVTEVVGHVVLAAGSADTRVVEGRRPSELLLRDFTGRTRSWLMADLLRDTPCTVTRVYFGSAAVVASARLQQVRS